VHKFNKFVSINENIDAKLKGYTSDDVIERIGNLMEIMPDRVKFGIPADSKGYSTSYRDANGAIEKIKDINHYYESKGENVKFYCWNISYSGSWDATKALRSKIDEFGGFGRESNINLKKVISYFSENSEDVDNIRSISISIDAMSIRKKLDKTEVVDANDKESDSEESTSIAPTQSNTEDQAGSDEI
jgi:hypothetical protein